jgi:hypothetical protein
LIGAYAEIFKKYSQIRDTDIYQNVNIGHVFDERVDMISNTSAERDERIARLRELVLGEWAQLKRSADDAALLSKDDLRQKHQTNRLEILRRDQGWIASRAPGLLHWFASGEDIAPQEISPRLVEVESSEQKDLFRLARYTWSLPYSKGFGRRLRFLVVDDTNGKLMGVLGFQSPPLDLSPRDRKFSFAQGRKIELVNQTMDIYVQGAVPPYNVLLGGKLIVLTSAAREVRQAYRSRYEGKLTEMEGRRLPARLVAVTTTSAFGRSSLYNRVVFEKGGIATK